MAVQSNEYTNEEADGPPDFPDNLTIEGVAPSVKFQIKYLSTSLTADNADIADLRFNTLVVGKIYRATYVCRLTLDTTGSCRANFYLTHDGTIISLQDFSQINNTSQDRFTGSGSIVFQATTTTLVSQFDEVTGNSILVGSGAGNGSYVYIEQLPYHVATTDFT